MQNFVASDQLVVSFGKQLKIRNTFSTFFVCGGIFSLLTVSNLQTLLFWGRWGGGYVLSTYSCTQNLCRDSSFSLGTSRATTKEGYRDTTSVDINNIIIIIIIMCIYHALINALSTHMIHINLHMIFYTHVEHSPTKTIYIK